jgi:hypothetical protein
VAGVGDEGSEALQHGRCFRDNRLCFERLAAVRFDDPVCVFQISFNP